MQRAARALLALLAVLCISAAHGQAQPITTCPPGVIPARPASATPLVDGAPVRFSQPMGSGFVAWDGAKPFGPESSTEIITGYHDPSEPLLVVQRWLLLRVGADQWRIQQQPICSGGNVQTDACADLQASTGRLGLVPCNATSTSQLFSMACSGPCTTDTTAEFVPRINATSCHIWPYGMPAGQCFVSTGGPGYIVLTSNCSTAASVWDIVPLTDPGSCEMMG